MVTLEWSRLPERQVKTIRAAGTNSSHVLGDRREGHVEGLRQVGHGELPLRHAEQDAPSSAGRERMEHPVEVLLSFRSGRMFNHLVER
jgi:hypothetical protein